MPKRNDKCEIADKLKDGLEQHSIARPAWISDAAGREPVVTEIEPIPKECLQTVLDVIAYSIEQILADALTRCVAAAVERAVRPLTEEIALLRIAFENDWERTHQPKQGRRKRIRRSVG